MGDTEDGGSGSPPLPKGSYNFNFDQFDDPNFNPFKTSSGISNSPDKEISDPFKSSTKLSSSPPLPTHQPSNNNNDEEENPFVTKTKLGQSPPRDSYVPEEVPECDIKNDSLHDESEDSFKTASSESPVKNIKGKKGMKKKVKKKVEESPAPSEDVTDGDASPRLQEAPDADVPAEVLADVPAAAVEEPEPVKKSPPKKASPKKSGMKKPKAKSKFKPPPNFGVQDTGEDVVIFAPPPAPATDQHEQNEEELPLPPPPTEHELHNNEEHAGISNQMQELSVVGGSPEMIDSVCDFGAAEMPMENNEEFVQAHEAFPEEDTQAWDMMENMKHDGEVQGRESLCAFDPLAEVPDRALNRRSSGQDHSPVEDDLMLMNTPQSKKTAQASRARNPAARALQEQLEGDGQREPHILDSTLYTPVKGDEKLRTGEGDERYFDALEYPHSGPPRKGQQAEADVERMNLANKKQTAASNNGSADPNSENFVQLVQLLKYSQTDWNKMKQELELDYNARILNKEREWSKKLADREKKVSYQDEQILLLRSANDDMKCVVAEFEKTIAQLQAEKLKTTSESQSSYDDVIRERNQALEDLQSVETAFSDLHQRYERTKGVVEGFKKNEETLKKCVQDYQQKLKQAEEKIVSVRQQAEEKLAMASSEMEKVQKSATSDVARLEAAYKKADLKISSLERSLDQKVKENDELTAICDELIAKVGGD